MKTLRFLPVAESELLNAARWYENQQTNLGKQFIAAVQQATTKIRINPLAFRVIEGNVRRCVMPRFPYGVLFRVREAEIVVIAIMHLHRDPMYWIDRSGLE